MSVPADIFDTTAPTPYEAVRGDIRHGDLLLCSGSAFFSQLIQQATNSIWSHVGIVLRLDAIGRIMVVESVESQGVRTIPLSSYCRDYNGTGEAYPGRFLIARHSAFPADENAVNLFAQASIDLFGYPYDKDEIAKIAVRIASNGALNGGVLKRDGEYICSELVQELLDRIELAVPHDQRGFIAPSDFAACAEIAPVAVLKV